jgi:hypothetical protein
VKELEVNKAEAGEENCQCDGVKWRDEVKWRYNGDKGTQYPRACDSLNLRPRPDDIASPINETLHINSDYRGSF